VDPWSASTLVLALLILAPLVTVVVGLSDAGPKWDHIASTVLGSYIGNTVVLIATVSVLSLLLAIPPAWLVSAFEFPGRRVFEWALVMPLAIPTYVAAFVYYQVPEAAIPLLIEIRSGLGIDAFLAAEKVLRYGLLSLILAGVLYPYLYLSARASFSQQRRQVIEAAQSLGRGSASVFFTVALPLARPALVAGLSLIVMEVVNDYGAVHLFGVPTLTEGIFRTWFGLGDRSSALRLAGIVMAAILIGLLLEQAQRGRARFAESSINATPLAPRQLGPLASAWAIAACLVPLTLGFLFPAWQLLVWSSATWKEVFRSEFGAHLGNSLLLALVTSAGLTGIAVLFSYAGKLHRVRWLVGTSRLAALGYAAPGAVVAVGVMVAFGFLDDMAASLAERTGLPRFFFSGTIHAIGFAYMVRFLAVSFQPVRAGMDRICGTLDEASRVLGRPPLATLIRVNLPLMRGTLLAAMMLVFVDILKELPLTMILRPANFETLATTAFGLAKEGRIQECAVPSLCIVAAGGIGLAVLNRFLRQSR